MSLYKLSPLLIFLFIFASLGAKPVKSSSNLIYSQKEESFKSVNEDEFKTASTDKFQDNDTTTTDEFSEPSGDEFSSVNDDEFNSVSDDEFSSYGADEFSQNKEEECPATCAQSCDKKSKEDEALEWALFIIFFTILAGFFSRFKATRKLRGLFLIGFLFFFGFYKAGCTGCPVSYGFQNFFLGIFGYGVNWKEMIWFIAIIPVTYVFGRVYCGWICHLGALQEILFFRGKFHILQSKKAQNILRSVRYVLMSALIIQLAVTGTRYWCKIDPFTNIFAFSDFYTYLSGVSQYDLNLIILITLIVLILVSSVIMYRPFCRTMCPVGLVLGLVSKIPGASVLGVDKNKCTGCKQGYSHCDIHAITHDEKYSIIETQDCIMCGDCIDSCKKSFLSSPILCISLCCSMVILCLDSLLIYYISVY